MIIGIGCDTVDIHRIAALHEKFGDRFIQKILCPQERDAFSQKSAPIAALAKRFAAKEACFKALGTGLRKGMSWHDICILNDKLGAPTLTLTGESDKKAREKCSSFPENNDDFRTWISLSDTDHTATAMVILEK